MGLGKVSLHRLSTVLPYCQWPYRKASYWLQDNDAGLVGEVQAQKLITQDFIKAL